ncbi:MAG: S8 family serine peptidase [Lachnospiraceae bacterium]|nr:S8 family serine peptidase [Lachnospiraceae bacterium]
MTELIFRYVGSETNVAEAIHAALPDARVAFLLNQYGIIRLEEDQIETFRNLDFLVHIEAAQALYYSFWKSNCDTASPKTFENTSCDAKSSLPAAALSSGFSVDFSHRKACLQANALDSFDLDDAYYNLSAACFPSGEERTNLNGRGILLCVIDSGIDYRHPEFLTADGRTRILAYWDQSAAGEFRYQGSADIQAGVFHRPNTSNIQMGEFHRPNTSDIQARELRYLSGVVYSESAINEALAAGTLQSSRLVSATDVSGHGTAVASVCGGSAIGAAPGASFLVVKLGNPIAGGFPRTSELMQGIDFCVRESIRLGMPAVVNLSFGNSYGSHLGTSLLETYIDSLDGVGKTVFVTGTGNEGAAGGHKAVHFESSDRRDAGTGSGAGLSEMIQLSVAESTPNLNIQIWKNYTDVIEIRLIAPTGESFLFHEGTSGSFITSAAASFETRINYVYHLPSYYQAAQELYLSLEPAETSWYILPGIWQIVLTPIRVTDGTVHLWLPGQSSRGTQTAFLAPTPFGTFTIPSTASKITSVGAYRTADDSYADFSGRGYEDYLPRTCKPDLVAPGTDILCAMPGGAYLTQSGTSLAAPFVSGACALLMQWGIISGHDPYLYGEKIKAYLKRGAKPLPAFREYPNPYVGYGKLCVKNSFYSSSLFS